MEMRPCRHWCSQVSKKKGDQYWGPVVPFEHLNFAGHSLQTGWAWSHPPSNTSNFKPKTRRTLHVLPQILAPSRLQIYVFTLFGSLEYRFGIYFWMCQLVTKTHLLRHTRATKDSSSGASLGSKSPWPQPSIFTSAWSPRLWFAHQVLGLECVRYTKYTTKSYTTNILKTNIDIHRPPPQIDMVPQRSELVGWTS